MSRVLLLLLAAAYAKSDDDEAAWVERWRSGGASRCTRTHCGWLADAGPIDVGCEFEISQTGLAKRGASPKAPELSVRPGGGPARSFAPHDLDEALDVPSLCAYREPGTIRGEDRTRQRGVVALIAASSLPYLFTQWAPLVNKMAYFRVMGLDWSLWLGDLDPRIAETTSKACEARLAGPARASFPITDLNSLYVGNASRPTSNHLVKVLAAYAQAERPGVTGVCYVDIDAMVTRRQLDWRLGWTKRDYVARRAHVFRPNEMNATALSWWSLDRDSFWRTKSMKFYVRAGDAVAFEILGRWVESRCGFKDQLPLWHALLGVADARGCLRVPYDGALYASFDYREALTYPARTPEADRPAPAEDAYLTTCADIAAKCPDLRICDSTARLLHGFYHQSVESTNTRSFAYATRKGKAKVLEVANSLRDFRDLKGCRSVYECPDYVRGIKHNADFVDYFALDMVPDSARPPESD